MSSLALRTVERKPRAVRDKWVKAIPAHQLQGIADSWRFWGRTAQKPPPGDWRTWLMLAGRGFGKTRAGAEWIAGLALSSAPAVQIALVGATADEARRVMIEGESGLLSVGLVKDRPVWEPSLGRLRWRSGTEAHVFGASNYDALRGPQHHYAWCDEIAKWAFAPEAWMNLQLGLRLGERPRALVTTTPRPVAVLRAIMGDAATIVTHGQTMDNPELPPVFTDWVHDQYAGTRLGRQELNGELIDDVDGALWTRDMIEACRVAAVPELVRVVVGVDPPAGSAAGRAGDACGIVVAALGRDDHVYVIADASVAGLSPEGWARAVATAAAQHGADRVVAEANNGGTMVDSVLRAADAGLPVKLVHAAHGKSARAEPVALLYARGLVKHLGAFPELEDELYGLIAGGGYAGPGRSPDRADALVWAVSALMTGRGRRGPRVRGF